MTSKSPDEPQIPRQSIWGVLQRAISNARDIAGGTARRGVRIAGQLAHRAAQSTRLTVGKVQRALGEDYYAILNKNPIVLDTRSRDQLFVENKELLATAFNVPWITTLLWSAAAGYLPFAQERIDRVAGELLHYGPGHYKRWHEVNKFMDSAVGVGHRHKFGHSIDYLPQIVEKFGLEGVPAYFVHLLQDFTTPAGIPIVPRAWDVKNLGRHEK